MKKHHIEREREEGAEAGRLGRKKVIEADAKAKKAEKAEEDRAALSVKAGLRETKSIMAKPKDKEEPGMSDSDKAQIGLGIGKGLLSARAAHLKDKRDRAQALARGLRISEGTRAAAGRSLIGAPVSLRKGGKVSFKDVLKAKKKMGY